MTPAHLRVSESVAKEGAPPVVDAGASKAASPRRVGTIIRAQGGRRYRYEKECNPARDGSGIAALWLNVGFYETYFAEDNRAVFFIKKYPTLQVRFENIFLSDQDDKPLERLSDEERSVVIEYCKYRLGIETELKTQDELDACKEK